MIGKTETGIFYMGNPRPPVISGCWRANQGENVYFQFPMYKKPKWITRKMMKWCFDIKWEDNLESKND